MSGVAHDGNTRTYPVPEICLSTDFTVKKMGDAGKFVEGAKHGLQHIGRWRSCVHGHLR